MYFPDASHPLTELATRRELTNVASVRLTKQLG